MTAASDELLDFLLSGIAICGLGGASSADFRRIINNYYHQKRQHSPIEQARSSDDLPKDLGRNFYEQVWQWVTEHPEVRIYYKREARSLSLSEFEALEDQGKFNQNTVPAGEPSQRNGGPPADKPTAGGQIRPSRKLLSLSSSLRQQLLGEGQASSSLLQSQPESSSALSSNDASSDPPPKVRELRKIPKKVQVSQPAFDAPDASIHGPRLCTSQNQTWIAITGHPIDLNKVPGSEFVLLSIIATSGPRGISQPELQKLSGQDKRSVPARTDSLHKKGYIDKRPIQWGKARTSLCTHKMYLKNVQEEPKSANDVFGVHTLSLTGLLFLLNKLLETNSVVAVRNLRKKLGVSVERWNGRAVRGALIRLEQTGYLRRFTVEKQSRDSHLLSNQFICVQRLREPMEDDLNNLKFKRIAESSAADAADEEPLEVEKAGEGSMQELEQDLMNDVSDADADGDADRRIPPQWTPDRLLTNLVVDAVNTTGIDGTDTAKLRDITTGFFWKRPLESLVTRLTDGWDKNQPMHVRHLALVRDTAMSTDKKRVHYLYRTHQNFQKAVDADEVTWDALDLDENKKGARSKKQPTPAAASSVDSWGFRELNTSDFHQSTGTSSLADSCTAIVRNRGRPRDWEAKLLNGDNALQASSKLEDQESAALLSESPSGHRDRVQKSKVIPRPLLTQAERLILGLPAKGRLGSDYESQIRAHREKTGDPRSLPDKLVKGVNVDVPKPKPRYERRPGPPLLTREERKARGLPEHGRLSFKVTEQILKEQGRNESLTHMKYSVDAGDSSSVMYGARIDDSAEELEDGQDSRLQSSDERVDTITDKEDAAVSDNTERRHGVLEPTGQSLAEAADVSATSEALHTTAEQQSPRHGSSSRKRPITEGGRKVGRPKKKAKRGYDKGIGPNPSIEDHNMELVDGRVEDEVADTRSLEDVDMEPNVSDASMHMRKSQAGRNDVPLSSAPVNERVSTNTSEPVTPSQKPKPSAKGHRGPYKKGSKPNPYVPLTKVELQLQEAIERYDSRVEPGVYFNPYATRPAKGGRGRPKKMYLATFKLPALHQLDWFVPDTISQSNSTTLSIAPSARARTQGSRLKKTPTRSPSFTLSATDDVLEPGLTPSTPIQTTETEQQPSDQGTRPMTPAKADTIDTQEEESMLGYASPPIKVGIPMELVQASDAIYSSREIMSKLPGPANTSHKASDQPSETLDVVEASRSASLAGDRASNDRVMAKASEDIPSKFMAESHDGVVSPQETSSANVNLTVCRDSLSLLSVRDTATYVPTNSYRSPYSPAASQEPPHTEVANADPNVDENTLRDSPSSMDTGGSNAAASISPGREEKDTKVGRGVILGKGSVAHARTRIIRHILDLCGGVFSGTEVMYPIFASVWEELGPKTVACPIPGTIRKAVIDLCRPHSDLKEVKFTVPRTDLPGNKTRSVFFYKKFEFTSPEVQKVVKGVIQTYPEKYCPPGVMQYWKEEVKPAPVRPKVDNSFAPEVYPLASRRLDERIKEARKERRRLAREAKEEERILMKEAKKEQKRLEKEQRRQEKLENSGSRRKLFKERQRLGGLNDGLNPGAGIPHVLSKTAESPLLVQQSKKTVPVADSSDDEPLINIRPRLQTAIVPTPISVDNVQPVIRELRHTESSGPVAALMFPTIGYHSSTHTFSTLLTASALSEVKDPKNKNRKRARIEQPVDQASRKKTRKARPSENSQAKQSENDFLARHCIQIQESSDEDDDDEQDKVDGVTSPTIAQRLAGLTGDLNKPDYEPVKRKRQHVWSTHRDRRRRDRTRRKYNAVKERKYPEIFDPLGEFRKLCYTLIVASSMAGEDGNIDWNIVRRVYSESPRFDLEKTKKTWVWMQKRMASQLRGMTGSFQSQFLSAYEEGKVDPIEDPSTYDWGKLVRWALLTCTHLEPPLPLAREALDDCQFDLSRYDVLDRTVWYNTTLANINRDERFARYTFGSPLYGKRKLTIPGDEDDLKARALIRANTSTPKELYNKTLAHEKLRKLPNPVIGRSVNDLLQASLIRQRKIKRLLPGRNYHFSPGFAKNYRRTLELSDFMTAVQLKKDLDAAFTSTDPEKRTYLVSRAAENGTVMALISLASEGKIKLVPQLPPIDNDFHAPIPRISVWGFSEGDYQHRFMDRKRLFWPLAVVPTNTYDYGSPLRPTPPPSTPPEDSPIVWNPIPEPPLPAREQDSNALLPIWNTIDGQNVIYPWWNRMLNIVVQALLFQPSITAQEIFSRCETYTTEVFEIQLVLDWLVTIQAAKRSPHGTYELLPGYWAVFGDKLIDEESDEFGEHVKRLRTNRKLVPTWRTEYNNEYNLRSQQAQNPSDGLAQGNGASAGEQILGNVRKQYTIVKHALQNRNEDPARASAFGDTPPDEMVSVPQRTQALQQERMVSTTPTPTATPSNTTQDVDMTDPDADADADADGEDVDAEGESDDEYL
ncbi:hypothetical protein P171DRAFT_477338 [Karstenula rhodostoma CBS 690.94]|uniref:B-block binding subunit of TFIIIC domain-containing protein n=1 Tax=Karstenula rhodostoma CBS 690.94 TaxID=1392251 RepID=A0A9P4U6X3_9PLEO|nr:hypothetical protein P171DRAFT_477338 [Karstenula rhodostoma CBS 690.94]